MSVSVNNCDCYSWRSKKPIVKHTDCRQTMQTMIEANKKESPWSSKKKVNRFLK